MIDELIARISDLEKRLANICRIAQVEKVHEDKGLVDVVFEGHSLKEIPFMTTRAGEDMTYWLPSVGELGELRAPSGDLGNAYFIPGIYYSGFPVPENNEALAKRIFRDGMEEEIDTDAHSYKYTTGDSERFVDRDKIEDKKGSSTIKIDGSETEIKRTAGKVEVIVGTTRLEVTAATIKGFIAGVGKISVNAALVNINGATFANGVTNLVAGAPITYPIVPIP